MEEPVHPHQRPYGLPGRLSFAAVVSASAWIVWAINSRLGWPAKVGHILAASTVAWLVGGQFGVEMMNAFFALAVFTMPVEGFILGGKRYGWPGVVAGFVVGLLLSPFTALLATALTVTVFMGLERIGNGRR